MANIEERLVDLTKTTSVDIEGIKNERAQFSVGSVEGVPFTACTSGPDIIILASNFSRVQQISASSQISSLDCSTDVGKIAAAYDNRIVIFEPIPLVQQQQQPAGVSKLDYKWVQTANIESETPVLVMSFNLEGTRLIVGGRTLQLWMIEGTTKTNWQCVWHCKTANNINYLRYSPDGTLFCSASKTDRLVKIWYESVTNAPTISASSTNVYVDSNASSLPTTNCLSPPPPFNGSAPTFTVPPNLATHQDSQSELTRLKFNLSFIYVAHPAPVTGLEWRRTSKYTPRGAVANVLITSCRDNIARVWVQTLLPDDGLVNFNQLRGTNSEGYQVNGAPRAQTQRHRQKLLRRLKRMKAFSQFKKRQALALDHSLDELEKVTSAPATSPTNEAMIIPTANTAQPNGMTVNTNTNATTITTTLSAHDFHSYAICSTVIKPGLHFHLAGIIEPPSETDLQMPSPEHSDRTTQVGLFDVVERHEGENDIPQFVVHWINNKEVHITRSIELLLHDMLLRILRGNNAASSSTNSPQSAGESCSGSENDTNELDDGNDDTITAESSKKLRHKLCRKMNKQRAFAASGRRDPCDSDDNSHTNNRIISNPNNVSNGRASPTSLVEEFDKTLELLLKKWQMSADLLFSINKYDGTLTIWQVNYLDGEDTGVFRQVQIDKLSHLKSAIPHYDATTMSLNVCAYSPSAYLDVKRAYLAVTSSSNLNHNKEDSFLVGEQFTPVDVPEILSINTDPTGIQNQPFKQGVNNLGETRDNVSASSISDAEPSIFIVTQHLSGILGLWKLNFDSSYPKVQGVDLVTRITGLPIDPSWLNDGYLIVEYLERNSTLVTRWLADQSGRRVSKSSVSPTQVKPSPYNFEEAKPSLNRGLPSVDEEMTTKPTQTSIHHESQTNAKDSYRASQIASNTKTLPQYHLKQLIELLAFGKLQKVKAILNHLVSCLLLFENNQGKSTDSANFAPWSHRSRTLSVVAQSQPSFHDSFDSDNPSSTIKQQVVEEIELDYIEVTSMRPLPLYALLDADTEKPRANDTKSVAHEDFSTSYESIMRARSQVDETLDEILGKSTIETLNKQKELKRLTDDSNMNGSLTNFSPKKAKLLTRVLTHTHLPGLTNLDQMHLLALADAVALFDALPEDINDIHDEDESSHGGTGIASANIVIDSLDDRGLRFLTAMRQHVYLTRCLPMKQRNELKTSGIGSHNLVWAFHSESQDELISLIPCVQRGKPEWPELREFGVGWWVKKLEVLRKLIEKVAQSTYQARQDPLDAALFYLAMKKKTLVCALLRRVNCDKRLLKLFEQDFNDPVNRKKALKNAYALLGLHRFEHAAAFFLLAGSIWDAVEVCINNLNDVQLAMILIRLYDNDANLPVNLKKLLFTEILGSRRPVEQATSITNSNQTITSDARGPTDRKGSTVTSNQYNYDPKRAHQDPFLRSMAFWKLGDYLSAVHTLLESDVGQQHHRPSIVQTQTSRKNSESLSGSGLEQSYLIGQSSTENRGNVSVSASVFNFYLFLKDQPLVIKHKQQLLEEIEIKKRSSPVDENEIHCHRARSLSSGELGFDEGGISRTIKQSSTEFEVLNETTRLVDKYSDEAIAEKERKLFFSTARGYLEVGCPILTLEVLCSEDHLNLNIAQRIKFIACLHILMNELDTLASSSHEPTGMANPKFRIQFFEWLQRSIDALKKICSYIGTCQVSGKIIVEDLTDKHTSFSQNSYATSRPAKSTMDTSRSEEEDEVEDLGASQNQDCDVPSQVIDGAWVQANEPVLRAMLTYCNLHSAAVNSLTTVRLELLNLLKKIPPKRS